jgi:hypothetical protein
MLSTRFFLLAGATCLVALAIMMGCSGSPISPDKEIGALNNAPTIVSSVGENTNAIGLLGAYELQINPETMSADLVTKRMTTAIGDSFVISGLPFFTIFPCRDCLKLTAVQLTPDGDLALSFSLKHPFAPGDTEQAPKASNRLDLDIFDVAAVIKPIGGTATTYASLGKIYDGICVDPAGYTKELTNLFTDSDKNAAMPFFLVKDDSIDASPPVPTYNEFAMGAEDEFEVVFNLVAGAPTKSFNMYLSDTARRRKEATNRPSSFPSTSTRNLIERMHGKSS